MSSVVHLPHGSACFADDRGEGRLLRATWHHREDLVVLSLWRGEECTATFRLPHDQVAALVATLQAGLDPAYDVQQRA
ncbi:hypothetical protein SAMN04488570_2631 [Nocardioides scoriae]|uniref:Uncharacterized protein n=1 Tax=Nocardioides scoriae TaxID=642780 RepID=A0A1H1UVH8_9ACTN|nr:hypothetical protein [Nocardioides scoriae]SDS76271.1 hypothetical protein SAMN04488570_2631 [Nocardioides scoriae]